MASPVGVTENLPGIVPAAAVGNGEARSSAGKGDGGEYAGHVRSGGVGYGDGFGMAPPGGTPCAERPGPFEKGPSAPS
jgi:hypothetical protein